MQLTQEDFEGMAGILSQILSTDNNQRQAAEAQLNSAKREQTDKYACLLSAVLHPQQSMISNEAKSLAAVILRRNISIEAMDASDLTDQENNANLWMRLSDGARTSVMQSVLETL